MFHETFNLFLPFFMINFLDKETTRHDAFQGIKIQRNIMCFLKTLNFKFCIYMRVALKFKQFLWQIIGNTITDITVTWEYVESWIEYVVDK